MRKVCYVSGCVPYNGKSGGRLACYNHLIQLSKEYDQVEAFFLDINQDYDQIDKYILPKNVIWKVYQRETPRVTNFLTFLYFVFNLIFSLYPRNIHVAISKKLKDDLREVKNKNPDTLFVFDHLDSCGNIPDLEINYIYISHNIEYKLSYENIYNSKFYLIPFYLINASKTYFLEKNIIKRAERVVYMSSKDMLSLDKKKKGVLFREIIGLKLKKWNGANDFDIMFLGSAGHYPNKEAVIWVVKKLSRKIFKKDSRIKIKICGMEFKDLNIPKQECFLENILFMGRVSDEELENQFLTNKVLLSPIVLGSGIKMKILEAASYGMPIFATPESLEGLDIISNFVGIANRRNTDEFVEKLIVFLFDTHNLEICSKGMLDKINETQLCKANYFS